MGMVVIQASIGVSGDACGAGLPAPMCRQMVVSLSAMAFQNGVQYSLWMLGSPCVVGFSLMETAVHPFAVIRFELFYRGFHVPRWQDGARNEAPWL